jgi:hypothetical protein
MFAQVSGAAMQRALQSLTVRDAAKIWHETARRVYRLEF